MGGDFGRYTWTGREWDAEIELQYNRARYYDPTTGRWISQDPLGLGAGDSNLYRYVNNSPVDGVDPSGDIVIYIHGVLDQGNWFQIMHGQMLTNWKGADQQFGFQFDWRGLMPPGGNPRAVTGRSSIAGTWKQPSDKKAVDNLMNFVKELQDLPSVKQRKEPIFIVAHSQGTMITLTALEKGMEVDGLVLLNSPLNINQDGRGDLQKALQNVATKATFFWSPEDHVARLINGTMIKKFNQPIKLTDGAVGGKFFQVEISGGHGKSDAEKFVQQHYAKLLSQPAAQNSLASDPAALKELGALAAKWQSFNKVKVLLFNPIPLGK